MLILTIRTDAPEASLGLYDDETFLGKEKWLADRKLADTIHLKIQSLLKSQGLDWPDINGVICYLGPGSFTGLRIGITVGNALAYGLEIPIVGTKDQDWQLSGIKRITTGENDKIVIPYYGSEPHITSPSK